MAIASKRSVFHLDQDFTAPRLHGAIVDRLTFCGTILGTVDKSYHLAHTRNRSAATPTDW